jgi:hypothetical protein
MAADLLYQDLRQTSRDVDMFDMSDVLQARATARFEWDMERCEILYLGNGKRESHPPSVRSIGSRAAGSDSNPSNGTQTTENAPSS